MSNPEPSDSYRRFVAQTLDAVTWAGDLTGNGAAETRFGRYGDLHARLVRGEALDDAGLVTAQESIVDCWDLIAMHRYLGHHQDREEIANRLRRLMMGPALTRDEDPGTGTSGARDFQVELAVGSQLVASGLPVRFPPGPDVVAYVDGKAVRMECKRPRSDRGLRRRLREANEQLQLARDVGEAFVGVCFLSVNVMAQSPSEAIAGSSPDAAVAELAQRLDQFSTKHRKRWMGRGFSAIDAVIVSVSNLVHAADANWWSRGELVEVWVFDDCRMTRSMGESLRGALLFGNATLARAATRS